jgi:flagellar basal-body rod modification protein FlgD
MTSNGVSSSGTAGQSALDINAGTGLPTQTLASQETFLQLLVAQIKNQDPLNPTDGTQFLSQLAQFSRLEQQLQMNAQLTDIKNELADTSGTAKP